MKVGPEGKKKLLNHIEQQFKDEERFHIPRDGTIHMLLYWIVGLIENRDTPDLLKELEK